MNIALVILTVVSAVGEPARIPFATMSGCLAAQEAMITQLLEETTCETIVLEQRDQ